MTRYLLFLFVGLTAVGLAACPSKSEPEPFEPYVVERSEQSLCKFEGHAAGVLDHVELVDAMSLTHATHIIPFQNSLIVVDDEGVKRLDPGTEMTTTLLEPAPSERVLSVTADQTHIYLAVQLDENVSVQRYTLEGETLSVPEPLFSFTDVLSVSLAIDVDGEGPTDGYLIIAVGEITPDPIQSGNAADGTTNIGAVLRVDPNNPTVPLEANPRYGGESGHVFAVGVRDPQGCAIAADGALWCADHGVEMAELHRVRKTGDLGWPDYDGTLCALYDGCERELDQMPQVRFEREEGCGVIGGYPVTNDSAPTLHESLFFANTCTNEVWSVLLNAPDGYYWNGAVATVEDRITGIGHDGDGDVLVMTETGVKRIVPVVTEPFPEKLSESGCVGPNAEMLGLIPYDLNSPLWTDGALKDRWLEIPPGTTIDMTDPNKPEFPLGSVLVKNFRYQIEDVVVPVETRVMVRRPFRWEFYTYRWDEDGMDATLLEVDDKMTYRAIVEGEANNVQHLWPDRTQCNICHGDDLEVLGPRLDQLDRTFVFRETSFDQLKLWKSLELISDPPTPEPMTDPADESAPLEMRARSWLHSNCAHCHRPDGWKPPSLTMDLRFETSFLETDTCGVKADGGAFVTNEPRIQPGDPDGSVLYQRLTATDLEAMPPLGRSVQSQLGNELVRSWIESLDGCPE